MDAQTKELFERYRELWLEKKEREDKMAVIRAKLAGTVNYRTRKLEHGGVRVTYSSGYRLTQWDEGGLATYARKHPEILKFRSEKKIKPRRSIKVLPR